MRNDEPSNAECDISSGNTGRILIDCCVRAIAPAMPCIHRNKKDLRTEEEEFTKNGKGLTKNIKDERLRKKRAGRLKKKI